MKDKWDAKLTGTYLRRIYIQSTPYNSTNIQNMFEKT